MEYTFKDYKFSGTLVRYIISEKTGRVFLCLFPQNTLKEQAYNFESRRSDGLFPDNYDWFEGALFHLQLSHHDRSPYSNSYKLGNSYDEMRFVSQNVKKEGNITVIETLMSSGEGYSVLHTLKNTKGDDGFEVESTFRNETGKTVCLEMFEGASLDALSPYLTDDGSKDTLIHVFRSGWATEGVHIAYTLPELDLGKSWGSNFSNFKIGTAGSRPTEHFFPFAAVEDRSAGVLWGMQLYSPSTWQMEFSRVGGKLSFSGGIGDASFGNWRKNIKNGESFTSAKALIAAVKGDIADLADVFLKMRSKDVDAYGETGMPLIFNEWCTSWGKPSHRSNIEIADKLKKSKIKYFVMDAGWYVGLGDWTPRSDIFPDGIKAYADDLKKRGLVPGIWMEFEATNSGTKYFAPEFDEMHIKHDGNVLVGQVNKGRKESFWDFRNPETVSFLNEKVIKFLKDNGFGYLKIDYNSNTGTFCDGAESGGEGLRQHIKAVCDFIKKIKNEIPEIIIENCSSGGMRLEPSIMAITAMSSFSDAHESVDIPVIAANLHYLIPPRQSQIWCVLKPDFSENKFAYIISGGFLGRLCWSGDITGLSESGMQKIYEAEEFYESAADIIKHGKSRVFRTEKFINLRFPEGCQAVLRYSEDGERALLVYHCFEDPKRLEIPLDGDWIMEKSLYPAQITVGDKIVIDEKKEIFGNVILLKKAGI